LICLAAAGGAHVVIAAILALTVRPGEKQALVEVTPIVAEVVENPPPAPPPQVVAPVAAPAPVAFVAPKRKTAPVPSVAPAGGGGDDTPAPAPIAIVSDGNGNGNAGHGEGAPGPGSGTGSGIGAGNPGPGSGGIGSGPPAAPAAPTIDKALLRQRIREHRRYPELARRRGIEGVVGLHFQVRSDGSVADLAVTRSADESLDEAAREAVLAAAPLPPVAGVVEIDLEFRLREGR
jgi:protein TonB